MQHPYYSQCGEDYLLWALFGDQPAGCFVDVGAFDGVFLSNTYSFEQCGWRGICVEPHPTYFPYCQQARPRSICLNVACVGDPALAETTFYAVERGLRSGTLPLREACLASIRACRGRDFTGFTAIRVPARTLNDILREHLPPHTPIDFVSIDVEGSELDVLHGFDLQQYLPRVVVAEAETRAKRQALSRYLAKHGGYRLARETLFNVLFAREPRDIRQLRRTTIDCTTEAGMHPRGPSLVLPDGFKARRIHAGPHDMLCRRIRKGLRRAALAMGVCK